MPEKVEGNEEASDVPNAVTEDVQKVDAAESKPEQEPDQQPIPDTELEKAVEEEQLESPTTEKKKRGRRSSDGPSAKKAKLKETKTPERLSRRLKNQKSGSKLPEIKDGDSLLPKKERRKSSSSSPVVKEKNGDATSVDTDNNVNDEKPAEDLVSETIKEQPQTVEVA